MLLSRSQQGSNYSTSSGDPGSFTEGPEWGGLAGFRYGRGRSPGAKGPEAGMLEEWRTVITVKAGMDLLV